MNDEVMVRRAAVLSVSTETFETDATATGRPGYMTDVKVWTSLAAARERGRMFWDHVKQRFDVPQYLEPEPEPEPEPELDDAYEDEPEEEEATEGPPSKKKKIKKKKKKKKKKRQMPPGDPAIVYAKPRNLQKR